MIESDLGEQMANKVLIKNQTQKLKWIQVKMLFYHAEFIKKVEIQYVTGRKMDILSVYKLENISGMATNKGVIVV